jgi:purine-nucleoside phosphorylase
MIRDPFHPETAADFIRKQWPFFNPKVALVLGSGLSDVIDWFEPTYDSISTGDIPGLSAPTVSGHAGKWHAASYHGKPVCIVSGRTHYYEGNGMEACGRSIRTLHSMGVQTVILTNAAGGIAPDLSPGKIMVIRDHINFLGGNPLIGHHQPEWGPRFPDMTHAYDAELRQLFLDYALKIDPSLREGIYIATHGPCFETPAEIRAFGLLGADAVGMSTVPETIVARQLGLRVLGLSGITNWAAGIGNTPLTHGHVETSVRDTLPLWQATLLPFLAKIV